VLFSHDKASGLISLRHYSISTAPSGIKKSLKALLAKRALPGDMGAMQDVSELVTRSGYGSVGGAACGGGGWRGAGAEGRGGKWAPHDRQSPLLRPPAWRPLTPRPPPTPALTPPLAPTNHRPPAGV
jgi:hypothetical protein